MAESANVQIVSWTIPDPGGDDKQIHLLKAPSDANGGGITIVGAYATNQAATGAGTTFTYQLLTYAASGTSVSGTITDILGGTAAAWAAETPKAFTITDAFVDAGEWIVLDYQEVTGGNPTNSVITLQYVMGK